VDGLVIEECIGKYNISAKVLSDVDDDYRDRWCYFTRFWDVSISCPMELSVATESLAAVIRAGFMRQVVTMELDTDAHTLKCWVDGGVVGSLQWAMMLCKKGDSMQIVSSAGIVFQE
jgi:hypothetical protein